MRIEIEIPKEFESDYKGDMFKDFFSRVLCDIEKGKCLCGNYEKETAEMFLKAFDESKIAFDTEKVVDEVKKLDLDGVSMVEDGKYKLVRKNEVISLIQTNGVCNGRQKSCKYCYKKDCPLSTEKTLSDKWSDIVKKGGVE